jgi:hypothetical protein
MKSMYGAFKSGTQKKSAEPGTADGTPPKARKRTAQGRHPFRVRPSTASFGYKSLSAQVRRFPSGRNLTRKESSSCHSQPLVQPRVQARIALHVYGSWASTRRHHSVYYIDFPARQEGAGAKAQLLSLLCQISRFLAQLHLARFFLPGDEPCSRLPTCCPVSCGSGGWPLRNPPWLSPHRQSG